MTPDEYERRLRSNLYAAYYDCGLHHEKAEHVRSEKPEACEGCGERLGVFDAAHDAYADWLRLRAVAGQPCWRHCLYSYGGEWHTERRTDCALIYQDGSPVEPSHICEPHQAQQQIAAILAAGGAE